MFASLRCLMSERNMFTSLAAPSTRMCSNIIHGPECITASKTVNLSNPPHPWPQLPSSATEYTITSTDAALFISQLIVHHMRHDAANPLNRALSAPAVRLSQADSANVNAVRVLQFTSCRKHCSALKGKIEINLKCESSGVRTLNLQMEHAKQNYKKTLQNTKFKRIIQHF